MKILQHKIPSCAVCCVLGFFSKSVLAQQVASPPPASPAQQATQPEQELGTLETVIVTAEKRPEDEQSVPIGMSALTEKTIADLNIASTNELMNFVPSLNVTNVNTSVQPFIRGVGTFTGSAGNESAVATYVDGVYYPAPMASNFDYNSIKSVEVLEGPQGTLFGRNADGGVVSVTTLDPSPESRIDADVGYANYDTFMGHFYGSTPITPELGVNLAVFAEDQGQGWGTNVYNSTSVDFAKNLAARMKLLYTGEDWKVRLIGDYNKSRDDASTDLSLLSGTSTLTGIGKKGGFYDVDLNYPSYGTDVQYGISLDVERLFNWGSISSISAYRKNTARTYTDLDASPITDMQYINFPFEMTDTEELQIASLPSSKFKWMAGFFIYYDDSEENPNVQLQPSFGSYLDNQRALFSKEITHSYAPFGQVTTPLWSDTDHLTLGVRYTSDERDITYRTQSWVDLSSPVGFTEGFQPPRTFSEVTERAAFDHQFASNIMGYLSYDRGFKSGFFNLTSPSAPPVSPEINNAYQMGMKTEFFDRRVRLNWEAFYYHIIDKQVQQRLPVGNLQTNAGIENHEGIDVDLTFVPTDRLSIIAGLSLLHAWYAKFSNSTFYFPCLTPTINAGCAASINGGGYYQALGDATGRDPTYAERATGTLSAIYKTPFPYGELQFTGSIAYHDGFYFDSQNTLRQPVYYLVDASAIWTAPNRKYDVTLWGKNLSGAEYYGQMQLITYDANYSVMPPRTYGITFGYHFD